MTMPVLLEAMAYALTKDNRILNQLHGPIDIYRTRLDIITEISQLREHKAFYFNLEIRSMFYIDNFTKNTRLFTYLTKKFIGKFHG